MTLKASMRPPHYAGENRAVDYALRRAFVLQ